MIKDFDLEFIERINKVEEFGLKFKDPSKKFMYTTLCASAVAIYQITKNMNISLDDLTFEILYNEINNPLNHK